MSSLFRRAGAKIARIIRRVGNPAAVPGSVVLYTKDDGGPTELFAVNEAGIVQLTPPLIPPPPGGIVSPILPNSASDPGASTAYSRTDHVHGIAAAAPAVIAITSSAASAEGVAASFARSDHVHGYSLPFTSWRKIGGGTGVAVAGGATVTLGTFTRTAGELVIPLAWVENNVAGAQWAWDRSALVSIADAMSFFFERTANANEFTLRVRNGTVATSRTVSWMVMGIVP